MITAVDTHVLLDIPSADPEFMEASIQALQEAALAGSLVVCDLVYAELCMHFQRQTDCCNLIACRTLLTELYLHISCSHPTLNILSFAPGSPGWAAIADSSTSTPQPGPVGIS